MVANILTKPTRHSHLHTQLLTCHQDDKDTTSTTDTTNTSNTVDNTKHNHMRGPKYQKNVSHRELSTIVLISAR